MLRLKYDEVFSFKNLYDAHVRARSSKRDKKPIVKFELEMLENLRNLHGLLKSRQFRIKRYHSFVVYEPKKREIQTLDYTARIVQHILCDDVLAPYFTERAILDNCVCQKGKGMHFALKRFEEKLQKHVKQNGKEGWVLKCDIKKFFASIPHENLKKMICNEIKDPDIRNLVAQVIDSYHTNPEYLQKHGFQPLQPATTTNKVAIYSKDGVSSMPPESNIARPKFEGEWKKDKIVQTGRGIPIGNQTSQIFGMFYLNSIDRIIKERFRIKIYSRYMDDFIIVHKDKKVVEEVFEAIKKEVDALGLSLNSKTQMFPLKNGLKYLGFRYYVTDTGKIVKQVAKKTKRRMRWRVRLLKRAYSDGTITAERVQQSLSAFHGHLKHADCHKLENELCGALKQITQKKEKKMENEKEIDKNKVARKPFKVEVPVSGDREMAVFTHAKKLSEYIFVITQKSPQKLRWSIVSKLQNCSIEVIENLYKANTERGQARLDCQKEVSVKLDLLNFYAETAKKMQAINFHQMTVLATQIEEVRKLLMGWARSTKKAMEKNNA